MSLGNDPSAALYAGAVMHFRRLENGRTHRLRMRTWRLWIDVDRVAETFAPLRLASHRGLNLLTFDERDHGPRDGFPLRPWVETLLAAEGVARPHRIMLLCFPRVLGVEFNPLALYVAFDGAGVPTGAVYQVRNTDGDLHPYAVNLSREGMRHGREKAFYVSPFIDGAQSYAFDVMPPGGDRYALRIRLDGAEGLTLIAAEHGQRRALSDRAIARCAATVPLLALKVLGGIYFHALRLRLKGARLRKHPGNGGLYPQEGLPAEGTRTRDAA